MITIDLEEAAKIIAEYRNRPQPKIEWEIVVTAQGKVQTEKLKVERAKPFERVTTNNQQPTTNLLTQCQSEYKALRLEQAQLSNTIFDVVNSGATRQQLKELYEKIESYRPGLVNLYRRMQHVKQYGTLPVEQVVNDVPVDLYLLKDQRKKMIDERCKLKAKITKGHIKPAKVQAWQLRLDEVDAEYSLMDEKIKKMEGR